MYKIVICDDEWEFRQRLSDLVRTYMEHKNVNISLSAYTSGHDVLQSSGLFADLYFIDEQMPNMSGMELASLIRQVNCSAAIIFVSHVHGAVFQSMRYSPLRFIRKDYLQDELQEALDAFCVRYHAVDQNITLQLLTTTGRQLILLRDVLYVESKGHYLIFYCLGNSYQVRGKLSEYEQELSSHLFSRTSQSFCVNLKHVTNIISGKIILDNSFDIPVSRKFKASFEHDYLKYQRILACSLQTTKQ